MKDARDRAVPPPVASRPERRAKLARRLQQGHHAPRDRPPPHLRHLRIRLLLPPLPPRSDPLLGRGSPIVAKEWWHEIPCVHRSRPVPLLHPPVPPRA